MADSGSDEQLAGALPSSSHLAHPISASDITAPSDRDPDTEAPVATMRSLNAPDLAPEIVAVLEESDAGSLTYRELTRSVADRLDVREDLRSRQPAGRETPYLYQMRYARMALENKFLIHRARMVSVRNYHDDDEYRLTLIAKQKDDIEITKIVEEFLITDRLARSYRPFLAQPAQSQSEPTSAVRSSRSMPVEWRYDVTRWCRVTLEAMHEILKRNDSDNASNAEINDEVAIRLQLTSSQRQIPSLQNEAENEYKARTSAARSHLRRANLTSTPAKGQWAIQAETGSEEEKTGFDLLTELLRKSPEEWREIKEKPVDPNDPYPGNPELDVLVASRIDNFDESVQTNSRQPESAIEFSDNSMPSESEQGDDDHQTYVPQIHISNKERTDADDVRREEQDDESGYLYGTESSLPQWSDQDICENILKVLLGAANSTGGQPLAEDDLHEEMARRWLRKGGSIDGRNLPPWLKANPHAMIESLYAYRVEHALRALSVVGCVSNREKNRWAIDPKLATDMIISNDHAEWRTVSDYLSAHAYDDWQTAPWMKELFNLLRNDSDGGAFEQLCAEVFRSWESVIEVYITEKNGTLDREGVDLVVSFKPDDRVVDGLGDGEFDVYGPVMDDILLVQCKRWIRKDVTVREINKLYGPYLNYLRRGQANGYVVRGALTVLLGELDRKAEQVFWDIRANREQKTHDGENGKDENQPNDAPEEETVGWSLWDSGRLLREIGRRRIGLMETSEGGLVLDREYLADRGIGMLPDDPAKE